MALVRTEGIVLKTHALGDTSRIAVAYTSDFGLVKLVAKGARRAPSRFGFALEPLSRSRFVFYLKSDRDLHLLAQAETLEPFGGRLDDLARLAHAQAALELIDRLVWGEEPHPALYDLLAATLDRVASVPLAALLPVSLGYQLQAASLLGYRPRLDACADCGAAPSPRRLFAPARGGLLCERCAGTAAGAVRVSAEALTGLVRLLERRVGEVHDAERAGEILRLVDAFLRQHFQRFQGLRSLDLLRSLPGREAPEKTPCPS